MLNLEIIRKEIQKHHPDLKLTDSCIKGIVEILKTQCPHLNNSSDSKTSDCKCDPCECDPCKC